MAAKQHRHPERKCPSGSDRGIPWRYLKVTLRDSSTSFEMTGKCNRERISIRWRIRMASLARAHRAIEPAIVHQSARPRFVRRINAAFHQRYLLVLGYGPAGPRHRILQAPRKSRRPFKGKSDAAMVRWRRNEHRPQPAR